MISDLLIFGIVLFAVMARNANRPWSMALFSALSILMFAGTVLWDIWRGHLRLRLGWAFLSFLGFLVLVGVQYLRPYPDLDSPGSSSPYTVEPYATVLYLLFVLGCFLLGFCIVNGFHSRRLGSRMVIAVIALGVVEAVYGLIQWLGGYRYIWGTPIEDQFAHGTIPNHNHYALLLNLAISAGVGYLYKRAIELLRGQELTLRSILALPEAPKLVWILVWLAIMGLGVIASASRMGIFAMFFCLGSMVMAIRLAEGKKRTAGLVIFVIIAIIGLGFYAGIDAAFERYAELGQPGQFEAGRMSLWKDVWPMIWKTPWFGKGLGSFQWTSRAYETAVPDTPAVYAHNDYLQVIAETGIAGLSLVILAFAACWRTAKRNLLDRDPVIRCAGLAAIGALSAAAVQEITDYALYIPGTAALFVLLIGLNERARWLRKERMEAGSQKPEAGSYSAVVSGSPQDGGKGFYPSRGIRC
jgi:O-antigen ligase